MILVVKNLPANAGNINDTGWIPELGRFLWRRAWQPTPVFLLAESHEQRSLARLKEEVTIDFSDLPAVEPISNASTINVYLSWDSGLYCGVTLQFSSVQFSRSVVSDSL